MSCLPHRPGDDGLEKAQFRLQPTPPLLRLDGPPHPRGYNSSSIGRYPPAAAPTTNLSAAGPTCPPSVPGHTSRSAIGSKDEGGHNHLGQNRRGPNRSAARALRACALGIGGTDAPAEASRAYKSSAKAAHRLPRPANSTRPRPAALRPAAEPLWPAGSSVDRISDRPLGVSIWVGVAQLLGRRVVRLANGPLRAAVFVARRARA